MRHILALTAFTALSSAAFAAPVSLALNVMNGEQPFTGHLTTQAGQTITVTLWQLYVSNVALIKADGTELPLPGLSLLNLGGSDGAHNVPVLTGDVPAGEYRGVRFDVGVPRALNHLDASTQPAPLGLDVGMFWAWNPGYIFSRFEGRAQVGGQTRAVALHMGADTRRLTVSLGDPMKPGLIRVQGGQTTPVTVNFNAARMVAAGVGAELFDLSNSKYVQVHGGAVADQLYLNLSTAFTLADAVPAAGMAMPGHK